MRIEIVDSNEVIYVIGVSEINNSNKLTQDELLSLAKSMSSETVIVQLMNGNLIADETHLLSASQNALNAQIGKYMLSRTLDVEIIVYASAQRQIGRALKELGVYDDLEHIAAVTIGSDKKIVKQTLRNLVEKIGTESSPPFEASSERYDRIREHFKIEEKEISTFTESSDILERQNALSRCIVSRVSLVAIDS
ncbi:MAG: KEOPS complex subunit Cgi121 [Candidatus Thorarchaeota archaeon]